MTNLENIKSRFSGLSSKSITVGFDGFIDIVVKVIRQKSPESSTYFESAQELGQYMIEKEGKNFSIELEEQTTKLGGNVPITANALGRLGPLVSCVGSLGHPLIHPVFKQMPSNCHLYSFADPGASNVLEFQKGKMMLAEMKLLNEIKWEFIKETIGTKKLNELFRKSDLIALLNWSELDNSTAIWKGLIKDIMPRIPPKKRPIGFFDLSDCSRRSTNSILEALELIKSFSAYCDVVLSLNLNEATIIYSTLTKNKDSASESIMSEAIYDSLNINTVVIHHSTLAIAHNKTGSFTATSFPVNNPVISTGAGDNFNAGFCAGMLMDLDTQTSMVIGHATSSLYMQSGQSPTANELLSFLSKNS
jgi:hypothetical protein